MGRHPCQYAHVVWRVIATPQDLYECHPLLSPNPTHSCTTMQEQPAPVACTRLHATHLHALPCARSGRIHSTPVYIASGTNWTGGAGFVISLALMARFGKRLLRLSLCLCVHAAFMPHITLHTCQFIGGGEVGGVRGYGTARLVVWLYVCGGGRWSTCLDPALVRRRWHSQCRKCRVPRQCVSGGGACIIRVGCECGRSALMACLVCNVDRRACADC